MPPKITPESASAPISAVLSMATFKMLDRRFGTNGRPGVFRQAERADSAQLVFFQQACGMRGIDGRRIEQRDLDEIHLVLDGGGNRLLRTGAIPVHGPHAGVNTKTFHGFILFFV